MENRCGKFVRDWQEDTVSVYITCLRSGFPALCAVNKLCNAAVDGSILCGKIIVFAAGAGQKIAETSAKWCYKDLSELVIDGDPCVIVGPCTLLWGFRD